MSELQIIAATTSAVTTKIEANAIGADAIIIAASLLAGAEEVDIFISTGGTWTLVYDYAAGAVVKLTATKAQVQLAGGAIYGVIKDATAGACAVSAYRVGGLR